MYGCFKNGKLRCVGDKVIVESYNFEHGGMFDIIKLPKKYHNSIPSDVKLSLCDYNGELFTPIYMTGREIKELSRCLEECLCDIKHTVECIKTLIYSIENSSTHITINDGIENLDSILFETYINGTDYIDENLSIVDILEGYVYG